MAPAPRRGAVAWLLLRSSAVLPLAPGIVTLLVLNTVLRGHPWDHEWGWAIYQAGFVTVFLGPLCAGIGAWDGTQLARAAPTIESSGRPGAARAGAWAAITGAVATIYLVLLVVLAVVLKAGGALDWPGLVDLSPIPGVLALCSAWAAVGVAIGYRWRTPLLAPFTALAAFGLTLVLYLAAPFLIRVGGATASILFLAPRRSIQVGQVVLFGAVTATALIGPVPRAPSRPVGRRIARAVPAASALAALAFLLAAPGLELVDRDRALVCEGQGPRLCVASPYRDRADWPRPHLRPYLHALETVGIPAPTTFSQAPSRPIGEGSLPDEILRGHPPVDGARGTMGLGGVAVLGAYLPDFCDIASDPALAAAYNTATLWLTSITSPDILDDPSTPAALTSADHAQKAAYLQHAFATLATCRP